MSEPTDWKALQPWQRDQLVAEKIMDVTNFRCTGKLSYGGNNTLWKHHYYTCQECDARLTVTDYYLEGCAVPNEHTKPTPPYSTSMDAAWLVLKKMEEQLFSRRMNYLRLLQECVTRRHSELNGLIAWPDALWFLDAEDICIAALRQCGETVV